MVHGSCTLETSFAGLEESRDHVIDSLTCRGGILKLQAQLERDPIVMCPLILSCIRDSFRDIAQDQYGNYLVQKMLPNFTGSQLERALKAFSPCFNEVCMSLYGSSVIHKLIDALKGSHLEEMFVALIIPSITLLATNQYGVYILIHMDDAFDSDFCPISSEAIKTDALYLAKDRFGYSLVKHLIARNDPLKDEIMEHMEELSMDPFGNFIIQHIMTIADEKTIWMCLATLKDRLVEMAMNKSGSNVLETLLTSSNTSQCIYLSEAFMTDPATFIMLCEHEYGNYVVQRILQCGSSYQQSQMRSTLREHSSTSHPPPHSKHLYELVSE